MNIEFRELKAIFGVAVKWKILTSNPFVGIPLLKVPDTMPSFMTKPDFDRLLIAIEDAWLQEVVIFAVATGMRQGEILNLQWIALTWTASWFHIRNDIRLLKHYMKFRAKEISSRNSSGKSVGGKSKKDVWRHDRVSIKSMVRPLRLPIC